jgi:hypothetical protein
MAWTTPIDWSNASAVPSGIVTAEMLNANVRENLNALSLHAHGGSAGDGASTLPGVTLTTPTLTNLVTLTFADQSANPDAAGELQRNGNDILWYGSSVANLSAADASAGTASLRSLGTTSVKAAAGNHSHDSGAEVNQATITTDVLTHGTSDSEDIPGHSGERDIAHNAEEVVLTRSFTPTANVVVWATAHLLAIGDDAAPYDDSYLYARLYIDGAVVQTVNIPTGRGGWETLMMTGSVEKVAGTYQSDLRVWNGSTGTNSATYWYKRISAGLTMGSVNGKAIP